jgi:hypothetical protein
MEVKTNWNKFDSKLYKPLLNMEIPDFNPGTISYDDFWDEQDRRCIEGFKPSPFMPKITNEHYFYLNMCNIELLEEGASRKTMGSPFYRELDRRLFNEIADAKKNHYGLIIGKPRRVGLSWVGANTSVYELLFYLNAKIGVAAGQDDKAQDFYEKVKYLLDNIRLEYRSGIITKNSEEIKLGYKYRENKQDIEGGLLSQMFMKTMYAKPTGFEGKTLSLAIFEEAGLFEDIIAAYKSTEPCFKEGSKQFGTPLVYGTGGEIDKGSKGYKAMWNAKKETYNLKKVFVSSIDYYPGDGIPDKETKQIISFFDFKTGRTNSKMAYDYIMEERKTKEGSEGFIKHIQSYPLKESDIFIKNSGGALNRKKLQAQLRNLDNCPYEIKTGNLRWKTNDPQTLKLVARAQNLKQKDKIHLSRGSKVEFIQDEEFGTVKKILDPIDHSKLPYNPDIGGCDSYDDEVVAGTGSLGGTIIYRCFHGMNSASDLPVAYLLDRGTSDEDDEFYSQSLLMSVFYDIELLIEHTKTNIIQYFKDVGGHRYLKGRPEIDGYASRAVNQYGFKMPNQHALKFVTRLLKAEVNNNFQKIWFEELLEHLIDFGESNSDLGSAYAMVMVAKLDMFGEITEGMDSEVDDANIINDMSYYAMRDGKLVTKTYGEAEDDEYSIKNMIAFDPEYDLEGEQLQAYLETKKMSREIVLKQQKDILSKYGNDIMAFAIEDYRNELTEK